MSKNIIDTIIVVPLNYEICSYYINNGEEHIAEFGEMRKIIKEVVPSIVGKTVYFFQRSMPFIIDVNKNTINEIRKKPTKKEQLNHHVSFELPKNINQQGNINRHQSIQNLHDSQLNSIFKNN